MMKWEMEIAEVEVVLERIWDLHDKLSDAIHSISRNHFLNSLKATAPDARRKDSAADGFVYVKDWEKDSAVAEAKSLNGIRTALENLEDQLEFFHTVQIQQRAERDAALARLEQSRVILALRLAEHRGKRYKVIEEALDFIGDVQEGSSFAPLEPDHIKQQKNNTNSNLFVRLLSFSINCCKRTFSFEGIGGALGNAALFGLSTVAVLHLHQVAYRNSYTDEINPNRSRTFKKDFQHERSDSSSDGQDWSRFDVLSARG